jgi:hypothetical protein
MKEMAIVLVLVIDFFDREKGAAWVVNHDQKTRTRTIGWLAY